jgi:hypothetical protein
MTINTGGMTAEATERLLESFRIAHVIEPAQH